MEYEIMYLVSESEKENMQDIHGRVQQLIEQAGGTPTGEIVTFERKLAYEIKHQWRGIYSVRRFTLEMTEDETLAKPEAVSELTRLMNLETDILRYIVVSAEDLPSLASFQETLKEGDGSKDKKADIKEEGGAIDEDLSKALKI